MAPPATVLAAIVIAAQVRAATLDARVLRRVGDVPVYEGGFGSALARHPSRPDVFYFLSDRGPNVGTGRDDEKVFPLPAWSPRIGVFQRTGGRFRRLRVILLRDEDGRPLVGLPPPPGSGGTGETAFDLQGRRLAPDPRGVDPEGLVAMADGTFWVSEEYGPSLLHVDARGRILERVAPPGAGGRPRTLPRVIAGRRANYGIEGLALTPDGRSLVALLQGPLAASGGDARLTRLLFYDLATGGTRQYAYVHDQPGLSNTAVAALSADELLVVERDGGFEGDARAPARHKRIYRARVAGATDLGDPEDGPRGRLFRGKMPEGMSGKEREAAGIRPVARELLLDLLALPGGYPHDKPEGLAVLGPRMLALVNDDDFGITDEDGRLVPKRLPGRGNARDRNRVLFIALDADLWK